MFSRTGIVYNVTARAVGVIVYKVVGNRYMEKRVNLRVEHVKHSKCRDGSSRPSRWPLACRTDFWTDADFLNRVKANAEKKKEAKAKGETVLLKRLPAMPREARTVSIQNNIPQTLAPIPYGPSIPCLRSGRREADASVRVQTPPSKRRVPRDGRGRRTLGERARGSTVRIQVLGSQPRLSNDPVAASCVVQQAHHASASAFVAIIKPSRQRVRLQLQLPLLVGHLAKQCESLQQSWCTAVWAAGSGLHEPFTVAAAQAFLLPTAPSSLP